MVTDSQDLEHRIAHELEQIDERLESLERVATASDGRLAQLVAFEERRDRREEALLVIEQERREASAEEQRAVTAAQLAERAARGTWVRSLVSPTTVVPILTAIGGIIATLAIGSGVSAMTTPEPAPVADQVVGQEP